MANSVKIRLEDTGEEDDVYIEDVEEGFLQDLFDLPSPPKVLKCEETNHPISVRNAKNKLQENKVYVLKNPRALPKDAQKKEPSFDDISENVQKAYILSSASYIEKNKKVIEYLKKHKSFLHTLGSD